MEKVRICKSCNKKIYREASPNQRFCSKKCYRSYYYRTVEKPLKQFPIYLCQICGEKSQLTFFPLRKEKLWDSWKCPKCGALRNLSLV